MQISNTDHLTLFTEDWMYLLSMKHKMNLGFDKMWHSEMFIF